MKQTELVNTAIDLLIQRKDDNHQPWILSDNKELQICNNGSLLYYTTKGGRYYDINFDKNIKNMVILVVLLRDYCNKHRYERSYKKWYKEWIRIGTNREK